MPDKRTTVEDAVSLIRNGDTVGIGGMTLYRRPMALIKEIIRQQKKDLTLLAYTTTIEGDILVGAGCVGTVRTSYFGTEFMGLAPMFRKAAEKGTVRIREESEATILYGLRAALADTGFVPARGIIGTDFLKVRPDLKTIRCPYTDSEYVAIPACRPDVAIIHVLESDEEGNAILGGNYCMDWEISLAAPTTILSTERIVPSETIARQNADIVGYFVKAVAEAPGGARPTSCYPEYGVDVDFLMDYVEACRRGEFDRFLAERFLG